MPRSHVKGSESFSRNLTAPNHTVAVNALMDWLEERIGSDALIAVGHRVDRVTGLTARSGYVKQLLRDKLIEHKEYICQRGQDLPEIRNWKWRAQ
jgi:hypothetical protein